MALRIGFVGELGYELHVPSGYGAALWQRLLAAGASFDIRPVGIEAQRVLRLEKGHIVLGQDTDALSIPDEVGMGWAVAGGKADFVGARSLRLLAAQPARRRLIGFCYEKDVSACMPEGVLVLDGADIVGTVTSAAWSETLGTLIGLAIVRLPVAARDRQIIKLTDGDTIVVEVTSLPFYDPKGERQKL